MSRVPGEHPRSKGGTPHGRQISARRVRDLISASIRSGHIQPDVPLAEEDLMALFNASRGSVRAALASLRDVGQVERRPRVGTRALAPGLVLPLTEVQPGAEPGGPEEAPTVSMQVTEERQVPSFPLVRERLGVEDAQVSMVENTWSIGEELIGIRTAYFPVRPIYEEGQIAEPITMRLLIEQYFLAAAGDVDMYVGADVADARVARVLSVPPGSPLITREMTYYNDGGSAIELAFDRYRADRVQLHSVTTLASVMR